MFPNLELLYKEVLRALLASKTRKEKLEAEGKNPKEINLSFEVFPQNWGSTATGNDELPDGEPVWAGQAITTGFTTVFHDSVADIYIICFDDKLSYMVSEPNAEFIEDLEKHSIAGLHEARKRY